MTRARYRKAARTLGKPSARVVAANEARAIGAAEARRQIRAEIEAGADATALYQTETGKMRRLALLGYLRRGMAALDD